MTKPTAYAGREKYAFFSYSHKDEAAVCRIISLLQAQGMRIWYDDGIDPGTEWDAFIADKILRSSFFVAFISQNYLDSENCKDELSYARDKIDNRLLVYLEPVALPPAMEMRLGRVQAVHYYTYAGREREFCDKFATAQGAQAVSDSAPAGGASRPYTGGASSGGGHTTGTSAGGTSWHMSGDVHGDLFGTAKGNGTAGRAGGSSSKGGRTAGSPAAPAAGGRTALRVTTLSKSMRNGLITLFAIPNAFLLAVMLLAGGSAVPGILFLMLCIDLFLAALLLSIGLVKNYRGMRTKLRAEKRSTCALTVMSFWVGAVILQVAATICIFGA